MGQNPSIFWDLVAKGTIKFPAAYSSGMGSIAWREAQETQERREAEYAFAPRTKGSYPTKMKDK